MRHLHGYNARFESVVALRAKLIESFGEQVPQTITFDVGYFEGSQHSKIWLYTASDLEAMYQKYPCGEINLWCDSNSEDESRKRKRDESSGGTSKRQKKEEEVDSVFRNLKEKHGNNFSIPQLRMWARMVANDLHDDLDVPPNVPFFGSTPKRTRQPSVTNAISGAAVAITKALGGTPHESGSSGCHTGISPGRAIELRMKNYEQLRCIQQLLDDGIFTEAQYSEQKEGILRSLRKL